MVNFGLLAAEIGAPVWGTPANFNGYRILAALLHGTLVVGVSQTCGVGETAPPIFGRAANTLGIGPQSTPCLRKNCANFFLSELRQISTNFGIFWQKDGKEAKITRDALIFHPT